MAHVFVSHHEIASLFFLDIHSIICKFAQRGHYLSNAAANLDSLSPGKGNW